MQVSFIHPPLELTKEDTFLDGEIEYLIATCKPATGRVSIYYESGALDFRYGLYNGQKHGLYEEFFENGDLKYWCLFQHGKKDFYDETYDKYGRLTQSDGWHQGLRHGRCESYELGQLSAIQEFKNGKRHGMWETYGPRKVTFFRGRFIEGEADGWHVWRFANNKREAEHHYDKGMKTDLWRDFYSNGTLKRERTYVNGQVVGEDRCYFDTGVLALSVTYKEGSYDGFWFEYYPNGTLMRSVPYKDGQLDGFERHYDRKLNIHREVQWKDGKVRSDLNYFRRRRD